MITLLHLSDVHLDTTFLSRSANVRKQLRASLRTSFSRAIDFALTEEVDAVLIAGDLFDSDRLSFGTQRFLMSELTRLDQAGIPCVYVAGNHDPGLSGATDRKLAFPSSCTYVSDGTPQRVELKDSGGNVAAVIWAAGHETANEERNLAAGFPNAEPAVPTIGLLHAHVTSAAQSDAHQKYAACTALDLDRTGYAYWALGHVHTPQQIEGESQIWYSGNIQGRTFRETGQRGGLLVRVHGSGEVEVTFQSFAPVEWTTITLDSLESVRSENDLEKLATKAVKAAVDNAGENRSLVVRLLLEGPCPIARLLSDPEEVNELAEELRTATDVLDMEVWTDRVTTVFDLDEYRNQPHLLSEVLTLIEEARADPELLEELLPAEKAGTWNSEFERRAYLGELLADLELEAATRLIVER